MDSCKRKIHLAHLLCILSENDRYKSSKLIDPRLRYHCDALSIPRKWKINFHGEQSACTKAQGRFDLHFSHGWVIYIYSWIAMRTIVVFFTPLYLFYRAGSIRRFSLEWANNDNELLTTVQPYLQTYTEHCTASIKVTFAFLNKFHSASQNNPGSIFINIHSITFHDTHLILNQRIKRKKEKGGKTRDRKATQSYHDPRHRTQCIRQWNVGLLHGLFLPHHALTTFIHGSVGTRVEQAPSCQ